MTRHIQVGLLGAGVVGEGILRLFKDNANDIERRLGARIEVTRILARNPEKERSTLFAKEKLVFDAGQILDDPNIDIVVEVVGGTTMAGDFVRKAINNQKSVVTANKALIAEQGHGLFELAEEAGVDLYFEAAVAGGIPVIRVLREALASDRITALRGIVNGTSNYILSRMFSEGLSFTDALAEAQSKGYAEADPTLDVSGGDAAHKLKILATLAFGTRLPDVDITMEGIGRIEAIDMTLAHRFGYIIKPLAIAQMRDEDSVELRVHPALLPASSSLASINGALNAIELHGAMLGPCLLSGYGAGALPTAMSVASDIVDVARNLLADSQGRVPQRAFQGDQLASLQIAETGKRCAPFYLRFVVQDQPGVLARIAGILGAFEVSIQQMVQEGRAQGDKPVQVVMITHEALETNLLGALREIHLLHNVLQEPQMLRIEPA